MSDFPMNSILWRARGTLQNEEIRYARILVASLNAKSPEAQATSLDTLLHLGRSLGNVDVPPDLFAAMRDQTPGVFPKLPWDARQYVLLYEWDEFQGPAMTAVLDKMVNQEHWLGTNAIALRRLSELSPDKARGALLDLLKAPTVPAFAGIVQDKEELLDTLGQLPDRELPELDAVSLQRLRPLQDGLSQVWTGILERYSTAAIAQPVRDWFEDHLGKMQCAVQANLVAYFLRVDAKDGSEKLRQAAQANPPDCQFLENLARVRMSTQVEQAALAALDDPQPSAVIDALRALAAYGSPAAKEPILRHFQQWHTDWATRVDELEAPAGKQQVDVESAYLGAVVRAQGWLPSDSDWQSAANWCVSSSCKQNVPRLRHPWGSPKFDYWIEILDPGHDFVFRQHVDMGNPAPWTIERLREKMLQFPKGYAFQIDTRTQEPHVIQHYYNELKPWAESHGHELQLSDGTV
jgi:hypothetical protein